MEKMDVEQFGVFISQLRREQGMTQKQLAEKVSVSDKAVSKWERGLSMPDIALLIPLAETLQVSVTELLQGRKLEQEKTFTVEEVDEMVSHSIRMSLSLKDLSAEERIQRKKKLKKRLFWYVLEIMAAGLETAGLSLLFSWEELAADLFVVEILPLLFGLWFFFFIRETLPDIYDMQEISMYYDGVFRMNLGALGIHFNNRNWPHILQAGRFYCAVVPPAYPVLYLLLRLALGDAAWAACRLAVVLAVTLGGIFLPMLIVGRKYE